jgi:subtilisin family serine protease
MDLVAPSGALDLNGDVRTIDREGNDGYETGNYTDQFGGTSATCPQVAGVAALMLSVNPFLTEAEVRTTLQQTATDMGMRG